MQQKPPGSVETAAALQWSFFLMAGRGTLERRVRRTGMLRSFFFTLEEWAEEERWNKANRAFS